MATCSALSCSSTHYTIITTCRFIKRCVKTRINHGEVQNLRAAPCQPRCGVLTRLSSLTLSVTMRARVPSDQYTVHRPEAKFTVRKNPQKHYKIPKLSFYISYRSIKSINLVAKYNLSLSTFSISVANCIFQNECRLYSQKADILEDFLSPQIKYLFQQKCIYICLLFY